MYIMAVIINMRTQVCYIWPKRRRTRKQKRKEAEKEMERNFEENVKNVQLDPDKVEEAQMEPRSLTGGTRV